MVSFALAEPLPWRSQATTTTTTPASVDSSYAFFKLADVDRRLRCAAWDAGCNVGKPTTCLAWPSHENCHGQSLSCMIVI